MKSPESLRLPLAAGASSRQHGRRIWHIGAGLFLLVVASFGWSCRKLIPDLRLGDCTRHHPDHWIDQQEETSYRKILSNIGARAGAKDGLIVASPSKGGSSEPDYFYTWTRDSALTIKTLLPRFLPSNYLAPWSYELDVTHPATDFKGDPLLEDLIRSYVVSQRDIQQLDTLSGDLWTGGLNEPKYTAEGKAFDGDWGRPQRDGPPLRALALIPYAHFLLDRRGILDSEYVAENLYDSTAIRQPGSLIKNDLEEIAHGCFKEGFDLWEEVNGHHLWTRIVAMRALEAGSKLARRMDDPGAATFYSRVAVTIKDGLSEFWVDNKHNSYWAASISGLDCGFLLSVIHSASPSIEHNNGSSPLKADNPAVLGTLRLYLQSFDGENAINTRDWTTGRLVGRYKGDEYDGVGKSQANPWFICSYSVAHVLYLAQASFLQSGVIHLTQHNIPFWSDLLHRPLSLEKEKAWGAGQKKYDLGIEALWELAEAYFELTAKHIESGSMSEQINRTDGTQCGARDLTWFHASFLEAARARRVALTLRRRNTPPERTLKVNWRSFLLS